MRRHLTLGLGALLIAGLSAGAGYWLGFRHAWSMGMMADAAPRGALAIGQTKLLESGRTEDLRYQFESDIDSGLMWWHELEQFPLLPVLNALSGTEAMPQYQDYVKRIAVYRKAHPSPFDDPELNRRMLDNVRKVDPAFAAELVEGDRERRRSMEEMIEKYGE